MLAPPPPVDAPRPVAHFDTECYPNYWLLKFRPVGQQAYSFRLHAGQRFAQADRDRIRLLFDAFCVISFFGRGYDVPMIGAVLAGYTTEQLKALNERLIVERVKPWELGVSDWEPVDHIDIMEVAPGAGSQKQYAGRIHCKTMQDLPYPPDQHLSAEQIAHVDSYCENDLDVLQALHEALKDQLEQRVALSARYGIDLRSKSDAQLAEAVLRKRCEEATGTRLYKQTVDPFMAFRYKVPAYISYSAPQLQRALELVRTSIFRLSDKLVVQMPPELEDLTIQLGESAYRMGIGGLHSQEKQLIAISDAQHLIRMPDVVSYYPDLILNSGEWPAALGEAFPREYRAIKDERVAAKALQGKLKKAGDTSSQAYREAKVGNEGGKIMINGTFGKTGSPYSILFAPTMLIQTTLTGQLSILMLIEWHEAYGIPVISANTDGIVLRCPRTHVHISEALIAEWERRTGLTMEIEDYQAIYARDVNSYIAVKTPDDVKRKGEYAKAGLVEKKNPDVEICADAAADYLANGTPVEITIAGCRDIRKFVTIQKVAGGGVKLWGEGPRKDDKVRDMTPTLEANGWVKSGRQWARDGLLTDARSAYERCFAPQRPEYLGKVVRWYYSTQAPGPIVYATNGNTVSLSYGARPCMTLPDTLPGDIDYAWYIEKSKSMLADMGLATP